MTRPESAYTQVCEDRNFSEWHQGCPWCAVWVVRVDTVPVQAMMQAVRATMADYVLPRYERQAHVTLAYRGLMGGGRGHDHAQFSWADLQRDIACLRAGHFQPFALQLKGAGSFATVPYLAVVEQPELRSLHGAMTAEAPYPEWAYVPHVTLGHYACEVPMPCVLQRLQSAVPDGIWWQSSVSALWLARYRTHDIAGPLYFEGKFDLHTRCYEAAPDALWPQV